MKKYKVTQEFMDALEDWRFKFVNGEIPVNAMNAETHDNVVEIWRFKGLGNGEFVQRLGALLNWINGEDVFEVGTPSYVVGLKDAIRLYGKGYIRIANNGCVNLTYYIEEATRFDNFEEASEWANKHFEVVEFDK